MWPRNTAGLMVTVTLGHCELGASHPGLHLRLTPLRLSRAGIDGPFRAQISSQALLFAARLPPALRRWSHQLTCYQRAFNHHPGCHRPRTSGVTTDVLPACIQPPPGCHRPCAGGATTDVLPACAQPPPGCHRPRAGGATTDVLPDARANSRRSRRSVSNTPARNRDRNPCAARRPIAPRAGCGLMWPRNTAGLMVTVTLGHVETRLHRGSIRATELVSQPRNRSVKIPGTPWHLDCVSARNHLSAASARSSCKGI